MKLCLRTAPPSTPRCRYSLLALLLEGATCDVVSVVPLLRVVVSQTECFGGRVLDHRADRLPLRVDKPLRVKLLLRCAFAVCRQLRLHRRELLLKQDSEGCCRDRIVDQLSAHGPAARVFRGLGTLLA